MHPLLKERLEDLGLDRLWAHQRDAWEASASGPVIQLRGLLSAFCAGLRWSLRT
jgi:hypothetical protein